MRIIQITDLHLPDESEDTRGIDCWHNLDLILKNAQTYSPDIIVFTGDFCYDQPRWDIYKKFAERLAPLVLPLRFIAGNHDLPEWVASLRELRSETHYYPMEEKENGTMLYLNSADAHLTEEEFVLLEKESHRQTMKHLLVFIHHPPVKIGVPHMDEKHAFAQAERIRQVTKEAQRPVHFFCGHYHNERTFSTENYTIYCTPSTCFQIDDRKPEFNVLSYDIGMRIIDVEAGVVKTFVRYVSRPSSPSI